MPSNHEIRSRRQSNIDFFAIDRFAGELMVDVVRSRESRHSAAPRCLRVWRSRLLYSETPALDRHKVRLSSE